VLKIHQNPASGESAKIKNHCSPSLSFLFFPTFGTNFHTLFNPTLSSRCSKTAIHHHFHIFHHPKPRSFLPPLIHPKPTSFKFPVFLPECPCSILLFSPCTLPHPSPLHRSPIVSVPHYFVLPSPAPLVSCIDVRFCVLALTRASTWYTKKNQ